MKASQFASRFSLLLLVPVLMFLIGPLAAQPDLVLLDLDHLSPSAVSTSPGVSAKVERRGAQPVIRVDFASPDPYAGLTLSSPPAGWDLSPFLYLAMDLYNRGSEDLLVSCRVNGSRWVDGAILVRGHQKRSFMTLLKRAAVPVYLEKTLFGMNGLPGGLVWLWDDAKVGAVSSLVVLASGPGGPRTLEISNVRATGKLTLPSQQALQSGFFPFIDRFGQFKHADWPGKIHSEADLQQQRLAEERELGRHEAPVAWDQYGGWKNGPRLRSTGFFRTEKYQGKWWLVDPEGRLFWSHGIDCVGMRNATPVLDRERFFEELPDKTSPLSAFYATGQGAARGYYREHTPYQTYDFHTANLQRKFGDPWEADSRALIHRRLRSWGVNTIANWSDPAVYLERKTAYVGTLHSGGRRIEGSEGYWGKFPDPYDSGFRQSLRDQMEAEKGKSAGDPWCIGYFVDNELSWGTPVNLAVGALASPADQPAKKAFAEWLKIQYPNAQALNAAWGTSYASWESFLDSRKPPDEQKAAKDLASFNRRIAEEYFRICREEIKRAAPQNLYLGCRFDFHFYPLEDREDDWLVDVAAQSCDVLSFNRYRFSAQELVPPKGVDRPIMIGEFHFGALDRGLLHTGLRSVANQQERAEMYGAFVRSALKNPFIVGTHWFQYADQPVTGRGDGENYQVGFVDVCDVPYDEIVQSAREIGEGMYKMR